MQKVFALALGLGFGVLQACTCSAPPSEQDAGSCTVGAAGCSCYGNRTCNAGLKCSPDSTCVSCPNGTEGCSCQGGCAAGLYCEGGTTCRQQATVCDAGALGCNCDTGSTCATGLKCVSDVCTACDDRTVGCECVAGACQGLVCGDAGVCRPAVECACQPHQLCDGGVDHDAVCLADCQPGFAWDAGNCVNIPGSTCDGGVLASQCLADNRLCTETPTPQCAGCLPNYAEHFLVCQPVLTCTDIGATCLNQHRVCIPPPVDGNIDATCGGCATGYILVGTVCQVDPAQTCAACTAAGRSCNGDDGGFLGCGACQPPTPVDTGAGCRGYITCAGDPSHCASGTQVCVDVDGGDAICQVVSSCLNPLPCNREGELGPAPFADGNNNCLCATAVGYYFSPTNRKAEPCDKDNDGWLRETARSGYTIADPNIQRLARCQLRTVTGFILENDRGETRDIALPSAVWLFETTQNDEDGVALPAYGPGGRSLTAAERNSLTKACVSSAADFNGNGAPDVAEASDGGYGSGTGVERAVFDAFSYFVELDTGAFEATSVVDGGFSGRYRIREKARPMTVAGGVPLRYGVERSGLVTSSFWQYCPRGRDVWFTSSSPRIGLDFAQFEPTVGWTGMNHHSQFKCVLLNDALYVQKSGPPDLRSTARHLQSTNSIDNELDWQLNLCTLAPDAGDLMVGGTPNPLDPMVTCAPVNTDAGLPVNWVGWAAVRIESDPSRWQRGCVSLCGGQQFLCPGAPPGQDAGACYTLCGDFAASQPTTLSGGGYSLRGEVPYTPYSGTLDGGGFILRPIPVRPF